MEYRTADDVLRAHWDGRLPVSPKNIAEAMGIEVEALTPDEPEKWRATESGHYSFRGGNPLITYNFMDAPVRQRFTIAHEIGHHVYGDLDAPRDTSEQFSAKSRDPREVAANRFAAALLMPAALVKHMVIEQRITDIAKLASAFGVSTAAMEFRLKAIGLL
ncbi:ImmA/IrrE family metallo-endopeptidase [Pseudomonas lurida]|jgi:Zn-dependent peptidase ImmA (M78 family)|uniref:ImmA/IrrE family metallo-endopeptidase n=1 Tax=Pseudomonas quebecensis TaxID=2995174 RepID=A0ABY6QJ07_9PSED|nr:MULTISPECIES: ImmA/IrrE family metallo-endopeptidase [Pseudomonas]MBA1294820.1 ImmA/IrrE family metallo-endopeptidase [Pseudomonas lurida]MCP1512520.1 Zn-dependent peptidase ImmA (M78 family) [Pseudomonas rhodesiae]MCX4064508.1 ImmA/IrrE family metallo-endopeptidase [Pseudomonas quebecensis]MDF9771365.1 Zn-dependent peptidase ImmA (M78 family) [Pseudomonas rhodesiae]UZW19636.1 ImmA/IrrE family metallo-endopeptidase [Pseudomonas quebecensis]